jgi:hypothetical protein
MFTHRAASAYKPRTKLYFGVSGALWSGAVAVAAMIALALYCLLTHRIPV